ncbi:MAG: UPF0149 family protein [Candidatus Accumulibacter sp.]|jgi:uncharacterized protein|uniref:UPF0149 family protein n=1 Tax=Accumulibacter sp. TaxID=2053492 RepID=UPI001A515900|nr:UPF0149 family protein [Accumulibacter sp.]MBL8395926.1 UPF0149 family protein [Accumulibacter sp.]
MSIQAQLSDQQLLRLEELLEHPLLEQAMRLDEVQGYLCAALSGPQPIPESQWLDEVLGAPGLAASDAGREAAELLRRLATRLEVELASGEAPLLLLYGVEEGDSASDYVPWCRAYLHGLDQATEDWFDFLGADDDQEDSDEITFLDEQLFPLFVLTGDAAAAAGEAGEEWLSGEELERLNSECEELLPQSITNIYRFWLAQRGVETIHRAQPKVGRNEPCPCGSGKKYKKCCATAPEE